MPFNLNTCDLDPNIFNKGIDDFKNSNYNDLDKVQKQYINMHLDEYNIFMDNCLITDEITEEIEKVKAELLSFCNIDLIEIKKTIKQRIIKVVPLVLYLKQDERFRRKRRGESLIKWQYLNLCFDVIEYLALTGSVCIEVLSELLGYADSYEVYMYVNNFTFPTDYNRKHYNFYDL